MNKNIKKLVLAGALALAVCGNTFAAPRGGNGKGGHEPNRAKVQYLEPKAEHHNGGPWPREKCRAQAPSDRNACCPSYG